MVSFSQNRGVVAGIKRWQWLSRSRREGAGATTGAERSGVPFGRVECFGASQSFGLRRQASWLKVWRGGGCKFSATERAHKRNGDQIDAEWRLTGLVTTSGVQQ